MLRRCFTYGLYSRCPAISFQPCRSPQFFPSRQYPRPGRWDLRMRRHPPDMATASEKMPRLAGASTAGEAWLVRANSTASCGCDNVSVGNALTDQKISARPSKADIAFMSTRPKTALSAPSPARRQRNAQNHCHRGARDERAQSRYNFGRKEVRTTRVQDHHIGPA